MKIALIGYGAMGRSIERLAPEKGHEVSVVIHLPEADLSASELAEKLKGSDAAIDFTTAAAVVRNVSACMIAEVPLVEGTTGWSAQLATVEEIVKKHNGSLVFGANFSIGVNLFYRIAGFASELFSKFPEYEVFIEEQHHSRKKDVPSGTALKLKDIVGENMPSDLSISATRAGSIPGTHRVGFDGIADQVLLEHTARSREGFTLGALNAAEWIVEKNGFYEFSDVMNELLKK